MAAGEAAKTRSAETSDRKQEEATASADSAEPEALSDLFPGRQSRGIPSAVAHVSAAPRMPGVGDSKERGFYAQRLLPVRASRAPLDRHPPDR